MAKIDFVPDNYIQQREGNRANLTYLVLLAVLMSAICVTFSIIKIRQRAARNELATLTEQMSQAHKQIAQLEELKIKSKTMMRTMVMTAELLEPIPRSIILASLTNNLPDGVSLLETRLSEKEIVRAASTPARISQYQAAGAKAAAQQETPQKASETTIEIKGIAPSDIEVAEYIARLSNSVLFDSVALVESKEHKIDNTRFREFKLKTMLRKNEVLSKEDIGKIKEKREETL
ncbi:MAG: PilN domain-containing protein [Planctomycetes bacterium]|nr:PilN domain-containing protein [Planctomycetota bacterium]